ncbi:hypothetical protein GIB67_039420 [Kingdonia uniflora]|uniref:Uncharacterized protein n=1 Tax=Kingdonia uniflora TaxID=39325 RepID=A0A7J7LIH1_9MAGN|nr:hypothetical protein GIB67_039420 [Kingdonia uniflora]
MILQQILGGIKDMKCSLLKTEDQKQQLLVFEKSVLIVFLEQLKSEAIELELERNIFDQELKMKNQKILMLQNEKHELMGAIEQLRLKVIVHDAREEVLKAEMESQYARLSDLQETYLMEKFKLEESVEHMKNELNREKIENDQLNAKVGTIIGLLCLKEVELLEAGQMFKDTKNENVKLEKKCKGLIMEVDGANVIREVLAKQNVRLLEDNTHHNMEIACLPELMRNLQSLEEYVLSHIEVKEDDDDKKKNTSRVKTEFVFADILTSKELKVKEMERGLSNLGIELSRVM